MSAANRKNLRIVGFMLALFCALTFGVARFYMSEGLTWTSARIVNTVFYVLMAGLSLLMMRLSDYRFKDFGVFFFSLWWQLLVGFGIAAAFTVIGMLATGGYVIPTDWGYLVPSQILTGIAEELFWRGLLLKLMGELLHSKRKAVPLNALLYGLWAWPLTHSWVTVILSAFIGLVFAIVRVEYDEDMGIPGLAFAHSLMNVF